MLVWLLSGWALPVRAAEPEDQSGTLRILVDKTFSHISKGRLMSEAQVKKVAQAGFNVVVPRAATKPEQFKRFARWAQQAGIRFMPWMRGTLPSKGGPKMVWADGTVTPICSPNSDRLWAWMTQRITGMAKLSKRMPSVMGVFLDYEIYARPIRGNAYSLSYDRAILEQFAKARGIKLPALAPESRRSWLKRNGLQKKFAAFQIGQWRMRCRRLREKVNRINPAFRFCVYPADRVTPFLRQAAWREWATARAPIILADASGYGRGGAIPQGLALKMNRQSLQRNERIADKIGFPHVYVGGIDPAEMGADPEFSGKNALAQTQVSDGYWVFYEGPTTPSLQKKRPYLKPGTADHEKYIKWFTWANRHITNGNMNAWREPRESSDTVAARPHSNLSLKPLNARGANWSNATLKGQATRLRHSGTYFMEARAGRPIQLHLRSHHLGNYPTVPRYFVFDPDERVVKQGRLPFGKPVDAKFTPKKSGIYQLITYCRRNAASVRTGAPHWVMAPPGYPQAESSLSISAFAPRLYFFVPERTQSFSVVAKTSSNDHERAAARVFDPDGRIAATGESKRTLRLNVSVPSDQRGKVWSLMLEKPKKGGIFDDVKLRLEGVPTLLSESPKALLIQRAK